MMHLLTSLDSILTIWQAITSGAVLDNPLILQSLLCLTFADIKKYHYYYWIAFPAVNYPDSTVCKETKKFCDYFTSDEVSQFLKSYDALLPSDKTLFLVFKENNGCTVHNLKEYENLKTNNGKIMLGFSDPSRYEKHPGWPLRNALALVAYHWGKDQANWDVVCFREYIKDGKRFNDQSIVISIEMNGNFPQICFLGEKLNQKLTPRKVDMSSSMDPTKLADAAVDLNLKLMHWRLVPDLDLQVIKSSSCLLFGAGTLGCNVARCLLGWGVRKITFVDNSFVSFSNPVRQTLFTFEDCLQGGKPKAAAAADALKSIFPGVESEGKTLSVPMPGHPVSENLLDQAREDVAQVEQLIADHDVIFLLTDTRESRWLPTLISASKGKATF
ncbi:Ubiquitin-like modifier-activating enzyme ATG7 [Argiope bruennichi]|uniref:Ubiquitin-like modifier-activating enzyme ATG7 n=1 Tax=Argiope bruennichi TaxID=94029 RepID=A0A8T0EQL2_ARGBR|nr:Ubiquitin-like modifier-activating enzyme ATG7 [Argiope bruennichi]